MTTCRWTPSSQLPASKSVSRFLPSPVGRVHLPLACHGRCSRLPRCASHGQGEKEESECDGGREGGREGEEGGGLPKGPSLLKNNDKLNCVYYACLWNASEIRRRLIGFATCKHAGLLIYFALPRSNICIVAYLCFEKVWFAKKEKKERKKEERKRITF